MPHGIAEKQYEQYLGLLSQRNKLLKSLKEKDDRQKLLEKKEQGFTLYLNGANTTAVRKSVPVKSIKTPRRRKTTEPKSDPTIERETKSRKGWTHESIDIATETGKSIHIKAKDIGQKLVDNGYVGNENEQMCNSERDYLTAAVLDSDNESEPDNKLNLTFTMSDIKKVRESLERSTEVADPTAGAYSAGEYSSDSEVEEELDLSSGTEDSIAEEADISTSPDIPRDIPRDMTSSPVVERVKSTDYFVLEFSQPKRKTISASPAGLIKTVGTPTHGTGTATPGLRTSAGMTETQHDNVQIAACLKEAIARENSTHSSTANYRENSSTANYNTVHSSTGTDTSKSEEKPPVVGSRKKVGAASASLTLETLHVVTKKVKEMSAREQRRLLRVLERLDTATPIMAHIPHTATPSMAHTATLGSVSTAGSLTDRYKTASPCLVPDTTSETSKSAGVQQDLETRVELVVMSNWGSKQRIGLTQLSFYDTHKQLLTPRCVKVIGAVDLAHGKNVGALVDGVWHTTRDSHMWSARYTPGQELRVVLTLPAPLDKIGTCKIWNYNKQLSELNIGVKDAQLLLNGVLMWTGTVRKGCGNQVFQFETCIKLADRDGDTDGDTDRQTEGDEGVERSVVEEELFIVGESLDKCTKDVTRNTDSNLILDHTIEEAEAAVSQFSFNKPAVRRTPVKSTRPTPASSSPLPASSSPLPGDRTPQSGTPLSLTAVSVTGVSREPSDPTLWLAQAAERPKSRCAWLEDQEPKRASSRSRSRHEHTPHPEPYPTRTSPSRDTEPVSSTEGPVVSRSLQRSRTQLEKTLLRSLTFVDMKGIGLEQSLNVIHEFDKSQIGRLGMCGGADALEQFMGSPSPPAKESCDQPESRDQSETSDFVIPELPKGKELVINIHSTWGDKHYVGLTGIEIFSAQGTPVNISRITACPADINILPGYTGDPRVVTNLINGVNRTRDDLNMWLAPYDAGRDHTITLSFSGPATVALIRVWNYNKSRIHSYRGARELTMALDHTTVFKGEVGRACGGLLGGTESYGDTILFTENEDVLDLVSGHDQTYQGDMESDDEEYWDAESQHPINSPGDHVSDDVRPHTTTRERKRRDLLAGMQPGSEAIEEEYLALAQEDILRCSVVAECRAEEEPEETETGRVLKLRITETWGDEDYMGLTGLELVGRNGQVIPTTPEMMSGPSLNDLDHCDNDYRTPDRLVSGVNLTTDDLHMWLAPFARGGELTVTLESSTPLTGLKLYNYNKSEEDTYRGVKCLTITLDGRALCGGQVLHLRRAPGSTHYDYGQVIELGDTPRWDSPKEHMLKTINIRQLIPDYEVSLMPVGFVFQLHIYSSWGDPFYVGLDGIEMYDESGTQLPLLPDQISACPHSVNVLYTDQSMRGGDVRTPDKLVNEIHADRSARNSWLAPILPNYTNRIYVVFDFPVTVSMIKLYNYSKNPERGVNGFGVLVDDLIVYHGILSPHASPAAPQTVLFSDLEHIAAPPGISLTRSCGTEQDVQLTNDKTLIKAYNNKELVYDPDLRPITSIVNQ